MSANNISGIDETRLDQLTQKVLNNLEQLEKRFEQLDVIFDETKSFYKSDSASKYRMSYESLRYNYKIIKQNILSYVTDLSNAKAKYQNFASLVSSELTKYERSKDNI